MSGWSGSDTGHCAASGPAPAESRVIEGVVNAAREAVVTLPLQGPDGQAREVEAVIDTGYSGYLTLPAVLAVELGLPFVGTGHAYLANDSEVEFDVYDVTVIWDSQPRDIEADATGSTPLVGMMLLDRHNLNIDVEDGGRVVIQAKE